MTVLLLAIGLGTLLPFSATTRSFDVAAATLDIAAAPDAARALHLLSPRASTSPAVANRAGQDPRQDPPAAEAILLLDRPTRRLIQQGLRNEGFDPGAPDGLFGPRTRRAIRQWQTARGITPTGYLDPIQTQTLRAAGALHPWRLAAPHPHRLQWLGHRRP